MPSSVLLVAVLGVGLCVIGWSGGDENQRGIEGQETKREEGSSGERGGGGGGGGLCPTWTLPAGNDSHPCFCGDSIKGGVRCDPYTLNVSIHTDFCMTYDYTQHTTYLAYCPRGLNYEYSSPYIALPHNVSELNSAMCGPLNRQGRVCGECKSGYGAAVISVSYKCYRCSGSYHGWGLYLFLELFPVTLLFLLIMLFQFRATSGSVNCFVLLAQFTVNAYLYTPTQGRHPFAHTSNYIIDTIIIINGFWNIDFFKPLLPPFCVSQNITGLHANAMLYIAVIHLLLLTALAYLLIELHARNYRIIVWLWRPFHKYYVKVHRNVNPRTSIIDAIATFLILSYSRIMLASFLLLAPNSVYTPTGRVVKHAVSYNGHWDYFGSHHVPFAVLAVIVLVLFNILPAVFLLLYPCKWFQKILGSFQRVSQLLHPFADTFQGCYKNGTDGGRDYRYFAGLYMVFRIVFFINFAVLGSLRWFSGGVLFLLASLSFALLRPYRNNWHNTIDTLLCAITAVTIFSRSVVDAGGVDNTRPYQVVMQLGCLNSVTYIMCYVFYHYVFAPLYKRVRRGRPVRGGDDTVNEERCSEDLPYRMLDSPTPPARWHSDTVDYITYISQPDHSQMTPL